MPIRRGNKITPRTRPELVVVDTFDQVLCSHRLLILWNSDGTCYGKRLLDQCWSDRNHSTDRNISSLLCVDEFAIPCCCWEICIEIRITQTPTVWCYIKPGIGRW